MKKLLILTRVHRLTHNLKPSAETRGDELTAFQRTLAEHLIVNPELTISGNRLHHEGAAQLDETNDLADRFSHLEDLFETLSSTESAEASPLIFRRETAFRSSLLGNSVPGWGSGMAVTKSFGPFIDEHGLKIWFDLYQPVRLVRVYLQGSSAPALLIPLWGAVAAKPSYRIEAGSVWIASELIARVSSLKGYYTGVKVTGGSLELSQNAAVTSGQIIITPNINAVLHLDLDQNSVSATPSEAGLDAHEAVVRLPETFDLRFNAHSSAVAAGRASCTVFGCQTEFQFKNVAAVWSSGISQILIPYTVRAKSNSPSRFQIDSSDSGLCTVAGSAEIDTGSGWLLPATKTDPQQLGEAAGTGALCIGLLKGITASWKGLKGSSTKLAHPAIIVEPGMITVLDFFAGNVYGKQRWILWRNANNSKHHSEITLAFGKSFPFIFISSAKNSEALFYFCSHKAAFDRPVDANGSPFKIESTIALAGILQDGSSFRVLLLDNDLLFDGNPNKADAFQRCSIILRNALFSVSRPYSLFLSGELENDNEITRGVLALTYGIYLYLPTLPDPYVASYTPFLRDTAAIEFGHLQMALAGFVKWPNPAEVGKAIDDAPDDPAYVYFKFSPLDQALLAAPSVAFSTSLAFRESLAQPAVSNFRTGVRTFNRDVPGPGAAERATLPLLPAAGSIQTNVLQATVNTALPDHINRSIDSGEVRAAIAGLEANPLLGHIRNTALLIDHTLTAASRNLERSVAAESFVATPAMAGPQPQTLMATTGNRGAGLARDLFMLLDVSSHADQMGVSLGSAIQVNRDERGATNLQTVGAVFGAAAPVSSGLQLQILNMDVVTAAQSLRAVTLPQISWEPVWNIPLEIEGPPDPQDLITVAPGLVVYDNDGIPTRIFSESPFPVPITPLSVTRHFLKEFHDQKIPRQLHAVFTLPFALIAQADFNRTTKNPPDKNATLRFNMPHFDEVRGGLQIKALAPASSSPAKSPSFTGWTIQLDNNLKWSLFGVPLTGSTLGNVVKTIFNLEFFTNKPKVPLEKIEFSGYGASMFSNWLDGDAAIAEVSQAKFDVLVGRTAHEVVQVRSILYPFGVHVVRTITLMRSNNGYVFRSDSGWKAESDGFYDFSYVVNLDVGSPIPVPNPYEFHTQPVKGVSHVREIRDYPAGGMFKSFFRLNDPDLPPAVKAMTLSQWQQLFKNVSSLNDELDVLMQAVVFDADVHLDNVISGGAKADTSGDFTVQSRKMLGYVQLAPSAILPPAHIFADLLKFQNGSLGGPVDCIIDIAKSKQRMRLARVDVNPALDGAGKSIFVTAARGSLILPPDGSWSVVKQQTDTGDVKPVEEGQSVPLIKPNGNTNFKIANPADVVQQAASKINFGVLQSTGTQKLLFDIPQFSLNQAKLKSAETYFADAYKLLNSKGVFPNIANALGLTNAEKEVEILGEGLMKLADRTIDLNSLLPANYEYAFINEPKILKIYAEYKSTGGTSGKLKLGIDSAAALADKWKAALSNIRVVVDLGPFDHLMWVDGNFNASSSINPKYDVPHLQFGPVLDPVVNILRILATLSGDDFDRGMDVGMSNSPDNWEYKFNCSKEIPVIKFPSPEELTIDPNPPLKLEAGLKVGFYFNEVLSIPTDLKQLVPACGAYVDFYGRLEVMCFSLAVASVYGVGQVNLGIAADSKTGIALHMKFGFGAEIVVGLPVVLNVSVLYMVEVSVGISSAALDVGAFLLFRGSAEICGGLVAICIQIEAGGSVHRTPTETDLVAQVTFSIDVCVLWVIDIDYTDSWQESRQIA